MTLGETVRIRDILDCVCKELRNSNLEIAQDFCNFYNQGTFIQPEIKAAVEMSRES